MSAVERYYCTGMEAEISEMDSFSYLDILGLFVMYYGLKRCVLLILKSLRESF